VSVASQGHKVSPFPHQPLAALTRSQDDGHLGEASHTPINSEDSSRVGGLRCGTLGQERSDRSEWRALVPHERQAAHLHMHTPSVCQTN
jgi:hypothetical protein